MTISTRAVIQGWHTRLNNAQIEQMMGLIHPQIEIGGPLGTERGAQAMREWFDRATVRLVPQRWFGHGNQLVVEELGEWHSPKTGQVIGCKVVATVFSVDEGGLITRIVQHDALEAALEDVCLALEDEFELSSRR